DLPFSKAASNRPSLLSVDKDMLDVAAVGSRPADVHDVAGANGTRDHRGRWHRIRKARHAAERDFSALLALLGQKAKAERIVDVIDTHLLRGDAPITGAIHDRPPDRDIRAKDVESVDENTGRAEVDGPVGTPAPEIPNPERVPRIGKGRGGFLR